MSRTTVWSLAAARKNHYPPAPTSNTETQLDTPLVSITHRQTNRPDRMAHSP